MTRDSEVIHAKILDDLLLPRGNANDSVYLIFSANFDSSGNSDVAFVIRRASALLNCRPYTYIGMLVLTNYSKVGILDSTNSGLA